MQNGYLNYYMMFASKYRQRVFYADKSLGIGAIFRGLGIRCRRYDFKIILEIKRKVLVVS